MQIIDSHCHPESKLYGEERDSMIERNLAEGAFMIAIGNDLKSSFETSELAKKFKGKVWGTTGLHPDEIKDDFKIENFRNAAGQEGIVAIGEIGLDYYRTPEEYKRERQKEVFLEFMNLAKEKDLPLVLHCRNEKNGASAHFDMHELLARTNLRGVAHSFTGKLEEARGYLNLGFYLGFNGIITFAREYDTIVKYCPLEQMLLETDAPWLAPIPYRGQKNEPRFVIEAAKKIAELKNEPLEKIIETCNQNCKNLFRLEF